MSSEIPLVQKDGPTAKVATRSGVASNNIVARQSSLKEQDLLHSGSKQSGIVSISMAEDVTMEDVGRILRLEDAHLLESLHFDTAGDTPVLGSVEGDLDDVPPLIYESKVSEVPNKKEESKKSLRRSASLGEDESRLGFGQLSRRFSQGDEDVIFRQCLSGEIKSFPAVMTPSEGLKEASTGNHENTEQMDDAAVPEGEETTISSTCCSHDASVSPALKLSRVAPEASSKALDDKRRTSSNDRKMNEAVQFAQAVGEMPPLDSKTNELRIIDEDDLDDTDDEDDNDDGNGTVIRLDELGSQIGSIHEHLSVGDNVSHDAFPGSVPRTPIQERKEQASDIPREIIKRKTRPQWPLQLPGWTFSHLETSMQTSLENTVQDYVYRGIHSNPPEIVKRGMSRGNHVQLHRKAWLEVSDKYHRYGKNLRLYYRHWESLDYPTNMFFDWLDSKGEAAGQSLPNLDECPRSKLDSDTVLYINNPQTTDGYALRIETVEGRARFKDVDDELVKTGPDGWIFVLRDGIIYGAEKITSINGQSKQRFHHSSFFGGKAVAAAGIFITDDLGFLTRLYPHSGHYRPREAHMQRLLYFLHHQGVDLRTFEMDTQQIMHVARDIIDAKGKEKGKKKEQEGKDMSGDGNGASCKKEGEKKKKIDSLQLMPAVSVACYVAHKAHFIGEGIFAQIHQIRNARVTSVTEALDHLKGKRRASTRKQAQFDCEQLV